MACECSGSSSHLPGFRFRPTDEELLFHFLQHRVRDGPQPESLIKEQEEEQSDCEPYELPEELRVCDAGWFFFTRIALHKSSDASSSKVSRRTRKGAWKGTGGDTTIELAGPREGDRSLQGYRKIHVYYTADNRKTQWVMHEYRLEGYTQGLTVLRHVINKGDRRPSLLPDSKRRRQEEGSTDTASTSSLTPTPAHTPPPTLTQTQTQTLTPIPTTGNSSVPAVPTMPAVTPSRSVGALHTVHRDSKEAARPDTLAGNCFHHCGSQVQVTAHPQQLHCSAACCPSDSLPCGAQHSRLQPAARGRGRGGARIGVGSTGGLVGAGRPAADPLNSTHSGAMLQRGDGGGGGGGGAILGRTLLLEKLESLFAAKCDPTVANSASCHTAVLTPSTPPLDQPDCTAISAVTVQTAVPDGGTTGAAQAMKPATFSAAATTVAVEEALAGAGAMLPSTTEAESAGWYPTARPLLGGATASTDPDLHGPLDFLPALQSHIGIYTDDDLLLFPPLVSLAPGPAGYAQAGGAAASEHTLPEDFGQEIDDLLIPLPGMTAGAVTRSIGSAGDAGGAGVVWAREQDGHANDESLLWPVVSAGSDQFFGLFLETEQGPAASPAPCPEAIPIPGTRFQQRERESDTSVERPVQAWAHAMEEPVGLLWAPVDAALRGKEDGREGDTAMGSQAPTNLPPPQNLLPNLDNTNDDDYELTLDSVMERLVEDSDLSSVAGVGVLPAAVRRKEGQFWTDEAVELRSSSEERKGVFKFLPQHMIAPRSGIGRSSSFKLDVRGILMSVFRPFSVRKNG